MNDLVRVAGHSLATNNQYAVALSSLRTSIHNAALENLAAVDDGSLTETEKQAFVLIEELRLAKHGLGLAEVLHTVQIYKETLETGAWARHPGLQDFFSNGGGMMAAAKSIGISLSEMDRYVDLVDVIFPFFEQNMEMSAGELWENVGKSKLVEILPVLKVLITGEQSTATVMGSVEALLNDARTTALASGEVVDDDQIRTQAIETLIQHAELLPNRQLRQHIRGERTPPIGFVRINHNGSSFLVGELDEPQMAMINRNFGTHVEITSWDPPEDGFVRQAEATRVPLFRRLLELFGR